MHAATNGMTNWCPPACLGPAAKSRFAAEDSAENEVETANATEGQANPTAKEKNTGTEENNVDRTSYASAKTKTGGTRKKLPSSGGVTQQQLQRWRVALDQ